MTLLESTSAKGTMAGGGPTLLGLPIKQASLITVRRRKTTQIYDLKPCTSLMLILTWSRDS